MSAESPISRAFVVSGRVQGVGYRRFIEMAAVRMDLRGWVRNLRDGRVEIVVQGDRKLVAEFEQIAAEGPTFGRVDNVENIDVPHEIRALKTFEIR